MAIGSMQTVRFAPDGKLLATLEAETDLLRLWALGEGADAAMAGERCAQFDPLE